MKLFLRPPSHCLYCGGYTMDAIEPVTLSGRMLSLLVHYYRCYDCRTCFVCLSNRRHELGMRSLTAWAAVLVLVLLLAAVAWAGMLLVRSIG